ncbi:MAG: glycoside hydrolase family 1 protein [Candidatus Dormibacteria bacterium]
MRQLPDDFLLGCATAAHQVEGHLVNDWTRMEREHPERIHDGSTSALGVDHFNRWREDLAALAALGQTAHRFSVEWSRIEPREGEFDGDALAHYADVVTACGALGLEPIVTLHHFTFPTWLADRGGLTAPDLPELFARYATVCATRFGDAVRWWVTVNEPAVLAVFGHLYGEWPPLQTSPRACLAALRGAARMHAAGYAALHDVARSNGRPAHVSLAHHLRPMHPRDPLSPLDRLASWLPDRVVNRWTLDACRSGRLLPPVGCGQRVPHLRHSLDYIALNYYCEEQVRFNARRPRSFFAENVADPSLPHSSFGWTIDASGLRRALVWLWQRYHLPVLITENGVADDNDELRPRFLRDHLAAVGEALGDGVDVRGYIHWTSLDNFEWTEGYSKKFGLLAVDRTTMERTPKPSAAVFADICRTRMV